MFCTGCGSKLPDGSVKCSICGKLTKTINSAPVARPPQAGAPKQAPPARNNIQPTGKSPVKQQGATPAKPQSPPAKSTQPPVVPAEPLPDPVFSPIKHDAGLSLGKALTSFTHDEGWLKKALILGLTMFVPILNFCNVGYFIQLARKVGNGIDTPLPEIDIKEQWKSGLIYSLAFLSMYLIWALIVSLFIIFAQIPFVQIFAFLFLTIIFVAFGLYFPGAVTLSIIEGNPWMIYNVKECFEILVENILSVFVTAFLIMIVTFLCSAFSFLIAPLGFSCLICASLVGQLGRIMRTRSKI